jgi:hypothetical protein
MLIPSLVILIAPWREKNLLFQGAGFDFAPHQTVQGFAHRP